MATAKTKAERKPANSANSVTRHALSEATADQVAKYIAKVERVEKRRGARNVLTFLVHNNYISVGAAVTAAIEGFENETDSESAPF